MGPCGNLVAPETARLFQVTVPLYSPTVGGSGFSTSLPVPVPCHVGFRRPQVSGVAAYLTVVWICNSSSCFLDPYAQHQRHTSLEVTAVATGSGWGTAAGSWGRLEGRGAAKGQGTWQGTVGWCLPSPAACALPGPALHALVPGAAQPQAGEPGTSHEGDLGVPGS